MKRRFHQLDVFTDRPLLGNPLAVVHDAQGLSDADMAALARWTHLSETTFLLPPTQSGADYRVRIFTPGGELPFAGHPTLGSCQAWLWAGGVPARSDWIVQECPVGLVPIRRMGPQLAFAAPPLRRTGPLSDADLSAICLALDLCPDQVVRHQWVDNGPGWCALMLADAQTVLAVQPNFAALGGHRVGLLGPHPPGSEADFEVRAFIPAMGVGEDPVTGSLNAGLAQWLIGAGLASNPYRVRQGTRVGAAGQVFLSESGGQVWAAGQVVACIDGQIEL
ncbi:MAG: PhzF family phenazine biosynthesis protein [Alphaproteobacteria bacterium]|nr:PhzF family phenazine biosynthesis protein [Alphaproteobacteria bacterium]